MIPLKIALVEDEQMMSEQIAFDLRNLGYSVASIVTGSEEAIKMISDENPDLIVIDININGEKNGIEVAHIIREKFEIPIIFIAAHSDQQTVEKAKEVKPIAFLLKPLSKDELFANIEIAVSNYRANERVVERSLLVKDGYIYVQIQLDQILFMSSIRNYVTIHLNINRKVMVRSTLAEMLDRMPPNDFLRINRGVIINIHHAGKIERASVTVQRNSFSLTKTKREELLRLLIRRKGTVHNF